MDNTRPKRIGIDARFYGPVGKGIGRYAAEVVNRLVDLDRENEYVVFLKRDNFDLFNPDNPRVSKVLCDLPWYSVWEQLLIPYYYWRAKVDLVFIPHFNVPYLLPARLVLTVHDLILTKFPTTRATRLGPLHFRIKYFFYRVVISRALARARRVIAVSEFTAKDISEVYGTPKDKITVIYEGVSELGANSFSGSHDRKEIAGPYFLYVGNAYPHKNLERLLEAFRDFKSRPGRADWRLVLVGREDYFYDRLRSEADRLGLGRGGDQSAVFYGYASDNELLGLYRRALAYIFPSLYEGFGLPPLEAMKEDCPVLSSNASCLPEILGEAAHYFDAEDPVAIVAALERVAFDDDYRSLLIGRGREQAARYDWDRCGREVLKVIQEALTDV